MNNCIVILFWIASRHICFETAKKFVLEFSLISSTQRCSHFLRFFFICWVWRCRGYFEVKFACLGHLKDLANHLAFDLACVQTSPSPPPSPLSKNRRRGPFSDFYWEEGESVHRLLLIQILKPFVSLKFFLYNEICKLNFISSFLKVLGCLSLTWEIRKLWLENPMVRTIPFEEIQHFRPCHFATLF